MDLITQIQNTSALLILSVLMLVGSYYNEFNVDNFKLSSSFKVSQM